MDAWLIFNFAEAESLDPVRRPPGRWSVDLLLSTRVGCVLIARREHTSTRTHTCAHAIARKRGRQGRNTRP